MWLFSGHDFSNIPNALGLFEADGESIIELVGQLSAPSQRYQLPGVSSTSNLVTLSTTALTTASQEGTAGTGGRSVPMEVCGYIFGLYFFTAAQTAQVHLLGKLLENLWSRVFLVRFSVSFFLVCGATTG